MRYTFFIVALIALVLTTVASCKKGCTNPNAVNYDKSAKEEDASCLYCDSVSISTVSVTKLFKDNNSSSNYYQDNIIRVRVSGFIYDYQGNGCKDMAMATSCNPAGSNDRTGKLSVKFESQISDTIVVISAALTITASQTEGFSYSKVVQNTIIPPFETVEIDSNIFIGCIRGAIGTTTPNLGSTSYTYR
ncbi:MAG TPA: hypothetical protein VK154_15745 [Chitinophagales bacterium]|nr:hypothetical protein [Chitinophagales bacterium]